MGRRVPRAAQVDRRPRRPAGLRRQAQDPPGAVRSHPRLRLHRHRARHGPPAGHGEGHAHRPRLRRRQGPAGLSRPAREPAHLRRPGLLRQRAPAPGRHPRLQPRQRRPRRPRRPGRDRGPRRAVRGRGPAHGQLHPPRRAGAQRRGPQGPGRLRPLPEGLVGLREAAHREELRRRSQPLAGTPSSSSATSSPRRGPRTPSTSSSPPPTARGPRSSWFPASRRASSSINPKSSRRVTSRSAWMPCTASHRRSGKPPCGFFQRSTRERRER